MEVNPQASAPEAPTPQAPGAAPPAQRISPQVQALMRKEQDAVRKLTEAKRLQAQIQAERAELDKRKEGIDAWDRSWKENPLKAVQERGLSPEQLWLMQQQGGQMTADVKIQMLQQELAAMREERNGEKTAAQKAQETAADQEVQGQISAFKDEINQHVEGNKEKYPLTSLYKRTDLIYSVIDRHHEKTEKDTGTGQVMSVEEASKIVEARLLSEARKAQEILSKTPGAPAQQTPGASRRVPPQSADQWVEKPLKTLAGIQQATPSTPNRYLSDEERAERAFARLRAANQARGLR